MPTWSHRPTAKRPDPVAGGALCRRRLRLAAAAGASKRTVYRHYPTKVELAVAAVRELAGLFEFEQATTGAGERLRIFLTSTDERDQLFGPVVATAVVNRHDVPELLQALREYVLEPRQALIRRFIDEGVRAGEIRPGVTTAAFAALSTGVRIDHLTGVNEWFGDARTGGQVFDQLWAMIAAE